MGLTHSFPWCCTRGSGRSAVTQERVIEPVSECEPSVDTHAGGRGVLALTTSERVEPPRGHGNLDAIRKLDDETLRGLAS